MKAYKYDTEILAHISREFLKLHNINRYRMKKIIDMSDKEVIHICHSWYEENGLSAEYRNFEKMYFLDWYWYRGLHDAEILEINELNLQPDYRVTLPKYNCLEILLDSKGALFETDVTKISLFNYRIVAGQLPNHDEKKIWWLGDSITSTTDNKYQLQLEWERSNGDKINLTIIFADASLERR